MLRVAITELDVLASRQITCSSGVATIEAGEAETSWMKCADKKFYEAKDAGRNGTVHLARYLVEVS